MAKATTTTTAPTPAPITSRTVWQSIKYVIIKACGMLVKGIDLVDSTLDSAQDIADSGRILTLQLKAETKLNAEAQIAALQPK